MFLFSRSSVLAALALIALVSLSACSDEPTEYYGSDANPSAAIQLSPVPPPALSDEQKPVLENPRDEVWRPGHWIYESQRFSWVAGEILNRPSPTAVWSPDRWEHRAYGWAFVHGYWE